MVANPISVPLSRLLEPLDGRFSKDAAQQIADLRASPEVQNRIDLLADKNREGTITPEELREYHEYVEAGSMIALLQSHARRVLRESA